MQTKKAGLAILFSLMLIPFHLLYSWNAHPQLTAMAVRDNPVWEQHGLVAVTSLQVFLQDTEDHLAGFLMQHEAWARENLPHYAPRPDELTFQATGDPDDILTRFFHAIRINPQMGVQLYLQKLPGDDEPTGATIGPGQLTSLADVRSFQYHHYYAVQEGDMVNPLDVLATATDEPDFGFDLGLFEDNGTAHGLIYGFGKQSFGNPNLEYSSQAPFHMGFYHEAGILYRAGPFLRRTWIDHRIFLYKALSEFAFQNNQPYWGWRFMGWGMHYVGDVSMPYHMKPLPGVSTCRMIRINTLAILGMPRARNNAVQLVSNRHTVFEALQLELTLNTPEQQHLDHPFLAALSTPAELATYDLDFLWNHASAESAAAAVQVDNTLARNMPHRLVHNPNVEVAEMENLYSLSVIIVEEKGVEALDELTNVLAERLKHYSYHVNSYLNTIHATLNRIE